MAQLSSSIVSLILVRLLCHRFRCFSSASSTFFFDALGVDAIVNVLTIPKSDQSPLRSFW